MVLRCFRYAFGEELVVEIARRNQFEALIRRVSRRPRRNFLVHLALLWLLRMDDACRRLSFIAGHAGSQIVHDISFSGLR